MSKSVLISIKPKWCELIALGEKTIEVRKTRPKLETPFKCYIYCTKGEAGNLSVCPDQFGKVIGEFVCDRIRCEHEVSDGLVDVVLEFTSCMDCKEILEYANGMSIYAWHISDLVIYDKPRKLSEFLKYNRTDCCFSDLGFAKPNSCRECMQCNMKRPPRSWCYVEDALCTNSIENGR